jgi:exopolysaccharide biosynthesis polyprenyl glycosylphosphotransferase
MVRRNYENYVLFSILMDATWVSFSLVFIATIRPALSYFPIFAVIPPPYTLPWILYLLFPLIWVGISIFVSVYDFENNQSIINELTSVSLGSIITGVFLAGVLYLSYRDVSRFLFIIFFILAYLGLITWRLIVRFVFKSYPPAGRIRKILLVGENENTCELLQIVKQNKYCDAFIINFQKKNYDTNEFITEIQKKVVLGEISDVIISVTEVDRQVLNDLLGRLHHLPIKVWVIPDYFQMTVHRAVFSELAGFPLLDLRAPALNNRQRIIKRAFDLIITFICLPILSPLMIIVSFWIRIDSGGPILLRQPRVGENGTPFLMFKFRTMVSNAEELESLVLSYDKDGNLIHKISDDPRVTKIGKFLRRWSLDEIPQVFNVLKGEMSLVGPRPELTYLVARYEPWQLLRLSVPQGITGWWQVNGRSEKPMHLHTADDIYYVHHYSLWLDILILLKTISVVIKGKGAF